MRELPFDDQGVGKMEGGIEEVAGASVEEFFIRLFHVIERRKRTNPV